MPCEIPVSPDMFENFVPPALSDTECFMHYTGELVFGPISAAFADAAQDSIVATSTFWVNMVPPPITDMTNPTQPSATVAFLQESTSWYAMLAAVVCVVIAAAGMMIRGVRRGDLPNAAKMMVRFVLSAFAGVVAISGALLAAQEFSKWIIGRSVASGTMGENLANIIISPLAPLGVVLVITLSIFAILASIFQIIMLIFSGAMLPVLTATLPLPAAMSNTEFGMTWFSKQLGWLVAFILYKPAASIVYAAAFKSIGSSTGGAEDVIHIISGIALIILAVLALPALMKLVCPAVASATASRGAGSVVMSAAAVAIPMGAAGAMGAARAGTGGPSGATGNPGGGGSSGPSGPNGSAPSSGGGSGGSSGPSGGAGPTPPQPSPPGSPRSTQPKPAPVPATP